MIMNLRMKYLNIYIIISKFDNLVIHWVITYNSLDFGSVFALIIVMRTYIFNFTI